MIASIAFTKASGAGNDFVIIDNMTGALAARPDVMAVSLCDRHFGIGADGLLILEKSKSAHFLMKYYNADGSYGGMCGNGGRCAARFAFLNGVAPSALRFEALDCIYEAWVDGMTVRLRMKDPADIRTGLLLESASGTVTGTFVDTGAPHLILFVDDLEAVNVASAGRFFREHPAFQPGGTNVNFVVAGDRERIALRTYERGVEAETMACGTGSVAAAVAACLVKGCRPPIRVEVRSGEELLISMKREGGRMTEVILEGSAHMLFTGECRYDTESNSIVDIREERRESSP